MKTEIDVFAQELRHYIEKSDKIAVSAHINADGDAIGSTLAMAALIEKLGKKPFVFVYFKGSKFDFILDKSRLYKGSMAELSPELFICLDCGDIGRLGDGTEIFRRAAVTFNIDHHISNTGFADHNLVMPKASSTCQLVYEVASRITDIDKYMAECIYTGLITDTCAFKHSQTSSRTMEIAGELMSKGIDFSFIQSRALHSHDMSAAKAFAKAVLNSELKDGICYTTLTLKEIRSVGAIFEQLDGIAEYCLNTNGARVSVFLYEKGNNTIKCSFRSNGTDVNKAAAKFGGGGHICAAGCTIEKSSLQDALEACLEELRTEMNE